MAAKPKHVTVRVPTEDFLLIRDEAYSKGLEMGPMVAQWIEPKLKQLRGKSQATAPPGHVEKPQ